MRRVSLPANLESLTTKFPTISHFSNAYKAVSIHAAGVYPDRCILTNDSPPLSIIKRAYGNGHTVGWLVKLLSDWQELIAVKNKMTVFQIHMLAETIMRDFSYLRASEIMLFLARLSGGAYDADWYTTVSPDVIVRMLSTRFLPERNAILDRQREKERAKTPPHHPITWEEYCRRHNIDRPNPLDILKP